MKATTSVTIIAYRQSIKLYLNGTLTQEHTSNGMRVYGNATLYTSAPWTTPAIANLNNLTLVPYSRVPFKSQPT